MKFRDRAFIVGTLGLFMFCLTFREQWGMGRSFSFVLLGGIYLCFWGDQ